MDWQTRLASIARLFRQPKMAALLLLGFGSGLPFLLTSRTLQAWMTDEQVNLEAIGAFSLVGLPYSLKFLWSPLLDRFVPPFWGRRRGWLAVTQGAIALALLGLAAQNPQENLQGLVIAALVVAFLSATQDIAADAYRSDLLEPLEMGAGAALFVLGYRVALLIAGGAVLIWADQLSWPVAYSVLAGLMAACVLFTWFAPEPTAEVRPPASLQDAVWLPLRDFIDRYQLGRSLAILAFIVLYRLGDALVNNMALPFLLKTGFSKAEVGAVQGVMGLIATIVGALTGGALLSQLGIARSLWVFGGLQALSNLSYLGLALVGKNAAAMVLAINVENFCGGLGTAGFTAFLMSLCNVRFSATQYALLSSLMAVSRDILVAPAGAIAQATGWPGFFLLTIVAAVPGLALLPWFAPWNQPDIDFRSRL
jgi:PAT family beta-lactamase induction signal transducer AmpG